GSRARPPASRRRCRRWGSPAPPDRRSRPGACRVPPSAMRAVGWGWGIAAAGLLLGVAACGGSSPSGATSATVSSSAAPSTEPSPSSSLSTGSETPGPTPAATDSWAARSIPLGQTVAMALDPAAVYALYQPGGGQTPADDPARTRVARLDRRSGALRTGDQLPAAASIAVSGGSLWVAAQITEGSATDTRILYRLDPATLVVRQRIPLAPLADPSTVNSLPVLAEGAPGGLWLGLGGRIHLLSTVTGRVLLSRDLGERATAASMSIDPTGQRLYVGTA